MDDLARDIHMKAIKRGKEALNLAKDFLNTGWGIYSTYKQIKSENVDRAIDRAANSDDIAGLERLANRSDITRKQKDDAKNLVKEYKYNKPLKKAYNSGDDKELEKIANDDKADWETRDKAREYRRDLSYRDGEKAKARDAFDDAAAKGDFETTADLISKGLISESQAAKLDPLIKRMNSLRNYNNPNSSGKNGISENDLDDAIKKILKENGLL